MAARDVKEILTTQSRGRINPEAFVHGQEFKLGVYRRMNFDSTGFAQT
jgi:hypothetical protein